jgi:membrane protease YdiL (CAAX protease family)
MSYPSVSTPTPSQRSQGTPERLSSAILLVLLLIRVVYLGGGRLLTQPDTPSWLLPSEMVLTYPLTSALIYLQRYRLGDFHITQLSLLLFLGAPFAEPLVGLLTRGWVDWPFEIPFRLTVSATAVVLVILLWKSRTEVKHAKDRLRWIIIALALGLVIALVYGWYFEYTAFGRIGVRDIIRKPPATLSDMVLLLSIQMMNAAVMEEPLFRGFLWGYLRRWNLSNPIIWLIQGSLFWLAHIYYLGQVPFSFWLLVPSAGLIFGWLAWRSHSIAPGLLTHTLVNGLTMIVSTRTLYFWW